MQTGEILLLATIAIVLLGGLVSLGVGHRRWSIGTVVAGFLVLLAAAGFLYLSARLANRDRAWARKVEDYKSRLEKTEDGDGGEARSIALLREERDRWRRGRDRVETWRGRTWKGASFQPPRDAGAAGKVELAPETYAEDSPPITAGSHVFLFDEVPFEEGGAYVGEFLVQSTSYDQATKRHVLDVVPTAAADAYDAKVLAQPHDAVTVFDDLPIDRWLAFYRSRAAVVEADSAAALPETVKQDAETVRELLQAAPEVGGLVQKFVDTFTRHEEDVPQEEREAAEREAAEKPGELWAEVEFTKDHRFGPAGEAPDGDDEALTEDGPKREYATGDRAEFDLQTAVELRDTHGAVTIERVFRRRPLTDALMLLHGATAPAGDGIGVDGASTLLRLLRDENAALERAIDRLKATQAAAAATMDDQRRVADELEQDLRSWRRDAEAAAEVAAGFERELGRTTRALEGAETAIVERGRELTVLVARLTQEIDRVAPPPERRAARP